MYAFLRKEPFHEPSKRTTVESIKAVADPTDKFLCSNHELGRSANLPDRFRPRSVNPYRGDVLADVAMTILHGRAPENDAAYSKRLVELIELGVEPSLAAAIDIRPAA